MGGKFVTTWSPVWLSCWRSHVTAGTKKIVTDSRSSVFILLASHRLCPASGNDVQHFFHRWILFSRNAPGYSSKSTNTPISTSALDIFYTFFAMVECRK